MEDDGLGCTGCDLSGGTATEDSTIGNIISSAYDFFIHDTPGVHVDYNKRIGGQIEEYKKDHLSISVLAENRLHSLASQYRAASCYTQSRQTEITLSP